VDGVLVAAIREDDAQDMVLSLYRENYGEIYIVPNNVWEGELPVVDENRELYSYIKPMDEVLPTLYHIEYHVVDSCNLNCKRCGHFSNIVKGEAFADLEEFRSDLLGLQKRFGNITEFLLLGGEPLLNPDLDEFIYAVKEAFPKTQIIITTNGLLVPSISPKVLKAIQYCGAMIRVSQYPPIKNMIDKILKFGFEHRIKIQIIKREKFLKFLSLTNTDYVTAWENCRSKTCNFLRNHRLYICPSIVLRYENKDFLGLNNEEKLIYESSADIINGSENGWDVLEKLRKPSFPCRYCAKKWEEVDWELTDKKVPVDKMDWVVDDEK
jgi:organic radical activating enzyme